MDPASTFQLAAAVIGVVDFGVRLISDAREIYRSSAGQTARNDELKALPRDLSRLSTQLLDRLRLQSPTTSTPSRASETPPLVDLLRRCIDTATKLERAIDNLQANTKARSKIGAAANSAAAAWRAS